jgi:hypothetical protein
VSYKHILSSGGIAMEGIAGATAQVETLDAQLMRRHLDRRNAGLNESGVMVTPDQQFQRDVLNGLGIGNRLDTTV